MRQGREGKLIRKLGEKSMEVKEIKKEEFGKKKRGRKRIKEKSRIEDQKKFFIDYSRESKKHALVVKLIHEANKKEFGRDVEFKDLVDIALTKLGTKDLERIRENCLTNEQRLERACVEHNKKHGTNYGSADFAVKQLKIN